MAERFTTRIKTSLNKTLPPVQTIDGVMFARDNAANEVIVELHKDGNKVLIPTDGTYATTGFITIADEDTSTSYEIPGTIIASGVDKGCAKVIIPANSAYAKQCVIEITIRLYGEKNSSNKWDYAAVIAAFKCRIEDPVLSTTSVILPTPVSDITAYLSSIQSMINHLDSKVEEVNAIKSSIQEMIGGLDDRIDDVDNMESSYAAAELAREKAEKGPNLDGQGGRVKAEADRVAAENLRESDFNKIRNLSVGAHSVNYYESPTAVISEKPSQNPNRKHIEFGLVPGVGVSDMHLTEDYKLYVGYSNGTDYTTSATLQGPRGETAYGMVVESYEESDGLLTLNNTANNSHVFEDDAIPYEYIDDLFRTL